MEIAFLHNTKFDFIGKRYIFFAISGAILLAGLVSLVVKGGPNYGIDFSGGILLQMAFDKPVPMDEVRSALLSGGITGIELQSSAIGQKSSIIMRAKKSALNQDELSAKVSGIIQKEFPGNQLTIERTEFVGPAVGSQLFKQALLALIFSFIGIIIYVAFRFHSGIWGASGVIGIMHDVCVIIAIFSLMNKEMTLTIVAALLTVAGYSINDTIVIFDRMRENLRLLKKETLGNLINISINQTMSRTVITSLTVFLVVIALFFLGGEVLHDFAFALLVGLVAGSYSTVFICSPLVYEWEEWKRRRTAAMFADKRPGQK